MKKALWITATLLLVSLTGCAGSTEPEIPDSSLPQPVIDESLTETDTVAESELVSFSAGKSADETAELSEESKGPPTATVSEPEAESPATEEPPKLTTPVQEPKPTEPPRQEPPPIEPPPQADASAPSPTVPPATEEPEPEPPEEIPAFNINDWISYAQGYASKAGLNLESSAVNCWDNPITAGPHSAYLKRDIESRLNRYSRDAEITDVWIWAEPRGDGSYDLYIGYA